MALFGYDDVLGERVLEEYEAESARRAPSAEKLRRETVASILAGEAVDVQRACSVLRDLMAISLAVAPPEEH